MTTAAALYDPLWVWATQKPAAPIWVVLVLAEALIGIVNGIYFATFPEGPKRFTVTVLSWLQLKTNISNVGFSVLPNDTSTHG